MAKIMQNGKVELTVTMTISEAEARALDGLVGYKFEDFVKVFYEHLGSHYLKPHEAGLLLFFAAVRSQIPPLLHRVDAARSVFNGTPCGVPAAATGAAVMSEKSRKCNT